MRGGALQSLVWECQNRQKVVSSFCTRRNGVADRENKKTGRRSPICSPLTSVSLEGPFVADPKRGSAGKGDSAQL